MDRNARQFKGTLVEGLVLLPVSVSIASDASVSASNNSVCGTWTHSATGEYTFVSTDKFVGAATNCVASATLMAATAVDLVPQLESITCANGVCTVKVWLLAGATKTDPSAACQLNLILWVKDSVVSP